MALLIQHRKIFFRFSHFFLMFPSDPTENIRKPKTYCLQGVQKGTLEGGLKQTQQQQKKKAKTNTSDIRENRSTLGRKLA